MFNRISRAALLGMLLLAVALPAAAQTTSTAGHYTANFLGVTYDVGAGTSTWRYELEWDGTSPSLSHFGIGVCQNASAANVLSYSPTAGYKYGDDPSTVRAGCFSEQNPFNGIKWDSQPPGVFEFVLQGLYAVGPVDWVAKAGSANSFPDTWCNRGTINGPSCLIAAPAIDVEKSCVTDAFVGPISYTISVTNSGNVPLTNVEVADPALSFSAVVPALAPDATESFTVSTVVNATGPFTNEASASGSYFGWSVSDSDSCTTTFWALDVTKTASTSFTRTSSWALDKKIDPAMTLGMPVALEICNGQSGTIPYEIDVTRSQVDGNFMVSGAVYVHNPAPIAADLASITDVISDGTSVSLSCSGALLAGGSVVCTYAASLSDGSSETNTATVMLSNGSSFSASAPVVFDSPTLVNAQAVVSDAVACPAGFTCGGAGPWTLTDSTTISYAVSVANAGALCDTHFAIANTATLTHEGAPVSDTTSASIYSCACSTGCTLTIGYWKTHAGFTGNNADRVTQYLPVSLGTMLTGKSVTVTTATEAVRHLSMAGDASNGINKLRAQLLAAKLNVLNGAANDAAGEIAQADAYLATWSDTDWNALSKTDRKNVLSLMSTLDMYNNGLIGPGHCN